MTNDAIKILANMAIILSKIEMKDSYTEEDYFNIFQLIDGYKKLEKFFNNKIIINELLDKKINDDKLYDLIRLVRNRYSHIDKHDKIDKLIVLQTKVKKEDIHNLINEIRKEMDNIFARDLNNDKYKLIMNTKAIINIFELLKSLVNDPEHKNEFDRISKELLKPIVNNFQYDSSTIKEYEEMDNKIIEVYKSEDIKKGIVSMYGISIYNEILRMLTDDTFTDNEFIDLVNNIKNNNMYSDDKE